MIAKQYSRINVSRKYRQPHDSNAEGDDLFLCVTKEAADTDNDSLSSEQISLKRLQET